MSAKLTAGDYKTMEEFANDVELIFANCRQFNPPKTYPDACVNSVEAIWKPLWAKVTARKLVYNEKRALQGIMNKIMQEPTYVYMLCSFANLTLSLVRMSSEKR